MLDELCIRALSYIIIVFELQGLFSLTYLDSLASIYDLSWQLG